jgi:hypothetical protein
MREVTGAESLAGLFEQPCTDYDMKEILQLITLAAVMAAGNVLPIHAQGTNEPLSLFINGGGSVSPLTNGEVLEIGQSYNMVATPDTGYVFSSWQSVNVFTFTTYVTDTNGNTSPVVTMTVSPLPAFTNQPSLHFVMQPVVVIYDNPGVSTITKSSGWQANFDPILLEIQSSDSAVILTWTNSSFNLQAAPTPIGVYTNVPGATSPYTNSISGPRNYFRLISN